MRFPWQGSFRLKMRIFRFLGELKTGINAKADVLKHVIRFENGGFCDRALEAQKRSRCSRSGDLAVLDAAGYDDDVWPPQYA